MLVIRIVVVECGYLRSIITAMLQDILMVVLCIPSLLTK